MLNRLLHYLILLPISLLPIKVLYLLSDLLFIFFYFILSYRKKVVSENIALSFPLLNDSERTTICRKFYKHLCDLFVESIKSFTISEKKLTKRFVIKNPELIDSYALKNQSVIVVGAHYNNWEMFAQVTPLYHQHSCFGIYKKLSNDFYNSKMLKSREKFGFCMFSMNETLKCFRQKTTKAIFFASDQSPSNYKNVIWTQFLNQNTAVQSGVERLAKLYDYPIFTYHITKIKRGYYQAKYELIVDLPNMLETGIVTKIFTKKIEQMILESPEFWLWSHKRWKLKNN